MMFDDLNKSHSNCNITWAWRVLRFSCRSGGAFRSSGNWRRAFIFKGLELNKSDCVLNQPLVIAAENRGSQNVAGGHRTERASGM